MTYGSTHDLPPQPMVSRLCLYLATHRTEMVVQPSLRVCVRDRSPSLRETECCTAQMPGHWVRKVYARHIEDVVGRTYVLCSRESDKIFSTLSSCSCSRPCFKMLFSVSAEAIQIADQSLNANPRACSRALCGPANNDTRSIATLIL